MNQVNSELSPHPQVVVDVGCAGPDVPPQQDRQHQVATAGQQEGPHAVGGRRPPSVAEGSVRAGGGPGEAVPAGWAPAVCTPVPSRRRPGPVPAVRAIARGAPCPWTSDCTVPAIGDPVPAHPRHRPGGRDPRRIRARRPVSSGPWQRRGRSRPAPRSSGRSAVGIATELTLGALLLGLSALAGLVFVHRPWPNRLDVWGYQVLPLDSGSRWAHDLVTLGSLTALVVGVAAVFVIGVLRDWVRAAGLRGGAGGRRPGRPGSGQAARGPAPRSHRWFVVPVGNGGRGGRVGHGLHAGHADVAPPVGGGGRGRGHGGRLRRGHRAALALPHRRARWHRGGHGIRAPGRRAGPRPLGRGRTVPPRPAGASAWRCASTPAWPDRRGGQTQAGRSG